MFVKASSGMRRGRAGVGKHGDVPNTVAAPRLQGEYVVAIFATYQEWEARESV